MKVGGGDWNGQIRRALEQIGPSEGVTRFLSKYGNVRTKAVYVEHLKLWFMWLRRKGVELSPDELLRDNLQCVFESGPTDVGTKRRHTDWLNDFVNSYMVERGSSESHRREAAAAVKMFYKRNDSLLFGDFAIASGPLTAPPKALKAVDIRKVLLALPAHIRTPLTVEWQSGIEISRVLGLRWADLGDLDAVPHRIDLFGRKMHRKPYFTYIGKDSIEHIAMLERKGDFLFQGKFGATTSREWLNHRLQYSAAKLMEGGLIDKYPMRSWTTHRLRHSFKSEAEHAGIQSSIVEFWMGHNGGIEAAYDDRHQVHEEDFVREHRKVEPYVSLNQSETVIEERVKAQFEDRLERLERQIQEYAEKRSNPS
jgi:integrase